MTEAEQMSSRGWKTAIKRVLPARLLAARRSYLYKRNCIKPVCERTCSICGYRGLFRAFGRPPRLDALCPACESLERHRLFWLWFQDAKGTLKEPALHFAPEPALSQRLRIHFTDYTSADLCFEADIKLDIESIDLPDSSIGTVICNHVLEHVDDKKAMAELWRILVAGGTLVASVPIVEGWDSTYEDATIQDPSLRDIHFGQSNHLRFYGRDFAQRLQHVGFSVDSYVADGPRSVAFGLVRGEKIFICTKELARP